MTDIIYYIDKNINYNDMKACKIGSTRNIIARMATYTTLSIEPVIPTYYYKINKNCYEIDDLIQVKFKEYNTRNLGFKGGTELYDLNYVNTELLESLFKENEIEFVKFNGDIIKDEIYKKIKNMTNDDYDDIIKENRIKTQSKELRIRNSIQDKYLIDIIKELNENNKCFIKAPTGFGKTHIFYKIIKEYKYKKILILTPRLLLNEQIVEDKYFHYIKDYNYKIFHYSNVLFGVKNKYIKEVSNYKSNFIMTSCYQSCKKLIRNCKKYNLIFDAIIYDEAHFITSWINKIDVYNSSENEEDEFKQYKAFHFLLDDTICKYKIFGSATPTEEIENNSKYFGKIIEKVKVHELINNEILCNIDTIIKSTGDNKKEYHNLKDLIVENMIKYDKKKGIVYVNDTTNAENLYKLMKTQNKINTYIYVSKEVEVENEFDTNISSFEKDKTKCIIIVVGKLGYGYDNDFIDFICLGDPRQSDIDIRQILGRGLRWKKTTYPNKLLHLLVPLYKDEFGDYKKNEHLKKYLDYIIGECDKDFIIRNGLIYIGDGKSKKIDGKQYDGEPIEGEIMKEYCTTGYNKFTDFQRFLKNNNVYNEESYNKLKNINEWMVEIGVIKEKYPKFCFKNIHPNNINYYWDKDKALKEYNLCELKLIENIGREKYKRLNSKQLLEKINELNNKIPPINFDLYY